MSITSNERSFSRWFLRFTWTVFCLEYVRMKSQSWVMNQSRGKVGGCINTVLIRTLQKKIMNHILLQFNMSCCHQVKGAGCVFAIPLITGNNIILLPCSQTSSQHFSQYHATACTWLCQAFFFFFFHVVQPHSGYFLLPASWAQPYGRITN